jgi:hypothetical protein
VPPEHPTPGTSLLDGPGNLVECPKGKQLKGGKCVAGKHKKAHKKHGKKSRKRANHSRAGRR